jgi:4-amino-4-deoxy-L-arabinose transferase-like glycosyltransferase
MDLGLDRWRPLLPALLLGALVAFVGLGWRGICDPDEGRYTNVAIEMLETGDFLHPHRHHETGHWTKPPLTYWAIASSLALFGPHPFAARLPAALAFLFSILLVFAMARALLPGRETLASVIYATSFLPFAASQIITTDYLLAAFVTLAVYGWVRARFARAGRALDTLDTSSPDLRDLIESPAGPDPNPIDVDSVVQQAPPVGVGRQVLTD